MKQMTELMIFTDGACSGNPGPGGWAVLIQRCDKETIISGSEQYTTNNRMELQAVIMGVQCLSKGESAILHSDSQYVINGITQWMDGWKKRNWINVKNRDLWEELDYYAQKHHIQFKWVHGHSSKEMDCVDCAAKRETQ